MGNYLMEEKEVNGVKKWKRRIKNNDGESSESKKSMHRDIERQRRQDMAALYASLRSLLPLQYVKGKRAVSDHMEQAVYYIKDMQKKIDEKKMQRNKFDDQSPNSNINYNYVEVNILGDDGIEILITTPCFPPSKVIAYLLGLGLIVATYVSTRGDYCSFYKLHIQLNKMTSIDIPELKERLVNLIN